jgi:hypothetical protein
MGGHITHCTAAATNRLVADRAEAVIQGPPPGAASATAESAPVRWAAPPPPLVPRRPRRRVLVADTLPCTADKASCSGVAFGQPRAPRATVFFCKTKGASDRSTVVVVPGAFQVPFSSVPAGTPHEGIFGNLCLHAAAQIFAGRQAESARSTSSPGEPCCLAIHPVGQLFFIAFWPLTLDPGHVRMYEYTHSTTRLYTATLAIGRIVQLD